MNIRKEKIFLKRDYLTEELLCIPTQFQTIHTKFRVWNKLHPKRHFSKMSL